MSRDVLEVVIYPELGAQSSRSTLSRTADEDESGGANTGVAQFGTVALSLHAEEKQQRIDAQQETDKLSERKATAVAHVSSSTYKPRYAPLIVMPDEDAQKREQQRRRDESVLERVRKRQLQLLQTQECSHESNGSENGHDVRGVWRFVGVGVLMGFFLSIFSFVVICCHEVVGLRGGRVNGFVLGVYIGMFLGFVVISVLIVGFADVSRFCNPVNAISPSSMY